jgi:glycosyltransferase involved in cell wall biosynthesis
MEPKSPLISVIIPSYNKGDLILATIQSVKAQKYRGSLEIIIIDDVSNDPVTLQAYAFLKSKYQDIVFLTNVGKGPGSARNTGIIRAKGEYIVFLDSDDLISPNFIKSAYDFLCTQPENCGFVYGDTIVFGAVVSWRPTPEFSKERMQIANYVPVTCLYRSSVIKKSSGMSSELPAMEDWDFLLSLLDMGFIGAKIPTEKNAWLFYRQVDRLGVNASVTTPRKRTRLRKTILEKHGLYRWNSTIWSLLAVVYSWLKPVLVKRELKAFQNIDKEKREEIMNIINLS